MKPSTLLTSTLLLLSPLLTTAAPTPNPAHFYVKEYEGPWKRAAEPKPVAKNSYPWTGGWRRLTKRIAEASPARLYFYSRPVRPGEDWKHKRDVGGDEQDDGDDEDMK